MEKSVEFIKRNYSPLTLAYLGDAFYETIAREYIIDDGNCLVADLNNVIKRFVTAVSQSRIVEILEPYFDEYESSFYKYGRNAHNNRRAKSANTVEYRRATGLECLFGFLYLTGRVERAHFLFQTAANALSEQEANI